MAGSARCLRDEMHLSIAMRSPRLQAHQRRNPVIAVVEELSREAEHGARSVLFKRGILIGSGLEHLFITAVS